MRIGIRGSSEMYAQLSKRGEDDSCTSSDVANQSLQKSNGQSTCPKRTSPNRPDQLPCWTNGVKHRGTPKSPSPSPNAETCPCDVPIDWKNRPCGLRALVLPPKGLNTPYDSTRLSWVSLPVPKEKSLAQVCLLVS